MFDIITIGGATRDIIFKTEEGLVIKNPKDPLREKLLAFELGAKIYSDRVWFELGGGACNTASSFAKLGLKTGVLARVGKDREGEGIINDLANLGIETKFIQKDSKLATGFSFIISLPGEKGHTIFSYRGANDNLDLRFKISDLRTKWFSISSLSMKNWEKILGEFFKLAFQEKIQVAWNPGLVQLRDYKKMKKFLPGTEILVLNKDEARELVLRNKKNLKANPPGLKSLFKEICKMGPKVVVITCGRRGAYGFDSKKIYFQKIIPVKVADTTGAGDAFYGGFVTSFIYNPGNVRRALKWGTANAAGVITKIGTQKGLLTLKQIKKYK